MHVTLVVLASNYVLKKIFSLIRGFDGEVVKPLAFYLWSWFGSYNGTQCDLNPVLM